MDHQEERGEDLLSEQHLQVKVPPLEKHFTDPKRSISQPPIPVYQPLGSPTENEISNCSQNRFLT